MHQNFKHTNIGLIPEDWEVKKLGEIGEVRMCRRVFSYQTKPVGLIPFYKIGTFGKKADAYISEELYNEYRQQFSFPKKGDILISASGTIGRTIIYQGEPAYFQDSNIVWIDNDSTIVLNGYLYHVLQVIKYNTEGGTIQRLYNSILKNANFPLPPLAEQTRIAEALSDMDALIAHTEQLLHKKQNLKQALMQKLLQPKEDWEVKKLKDIGTIITGSTPPTHIKEYWNGDIPWVTPTDITTNKDIYTSEREITMKGLSIIRKLPKHTLLVTCIASIGKNAILRKIGASNQQINAIIPTNESNVDFLYYTIEHHKGILVGNAGITATLILSKKEFGEVKIPFPPLAEQTHIATILSDADLELLSLSRKIAKLRLQKQGMMQALLTGKIRLL